MTHRTAWLFLMPLLAGVVGLGWYFGREPTKVVAPQRPAAATIPVASAYAERGDFPIFLTGLGTVQAYNMVTVKARVDGHLDKVAFVEGQTVKEGDLLAQIDPRPLQAQLAQARAAKIRAEAQLANAKLDLERSKTLVAREFATRQSVDTQRALVAQLEAAVQGDQAAIDSAEVQLGYTTIVSPISGRTGMRLVDKGNIVRATDTNALVVITQVQPISVVFTLPQDVLGDVNREMSRGPLKVFAHNQGGTTLLGEGVLALVDNQVDAATGTIRLKAIFANSDNALWPGQFVNARLLLRIRREVVTVPAQAVQRGPNGAFAYVIKSDQSVEQRPVKVGYTREGTSLIEEGLKSNDQVVIEGQYKLRAGARVQVGRSNRPQDGKGGASQRDMTQ
jgi:membrane fusion protein, multidrug efflux system